MRAVILRPVASAEGSLHCHPEASQGRGIWGGERYGLPRFLTIAPLRFGMTEIISTEARQVSMTLSAYR